MFCLFVVFSNTDTVSWKLRLVTSVTGGVGGGGGGGGVNNLILLRRLCYQKKIYIYT